jgi:hypothetical protein
VQVRKSEARLVEATVRDCAKVLRDHGYAVSANLILERYKLK